MSILPFRILISSRLLVLTGILVFGCHSVFPQPASALPEDVGDVMLSGSAKQLRHLGRRGGEGAWFALAEIAEHSGRHDLAAEMRKKSVSRDGAPFSTLSLIALLTDNPGALNRPLSAIRRAERLDDSNEGLRRVRIAVLAKRGRTRALAGEMADFRGEAWEAPVLAAAVKKRKSTLAARQLLEDFILHCSDAAVLNQFPPDVGEGLDAARRFLLEARIAHAQGRHRAALDSYGAWMRASTGEQTFRNGHLSPVFDEIAQSARRLGDEAEWAENLYDLAQTWPEGTGYGAAYQAGKLYREAGIKQMAVSSFAMAVDAAPNGLLADRARWHRQWLLFDNPDLSADDERWELLHLTESWDDAQRFTGILEEFIHRQVRRGEWAVLERAYQEGKTLWPPTVCAQAAAVLAFATLEGYLANRSAVGLFEETLAAAPFSWAGLRAAGILNRRLSIRPSPGIREDGLHDELARLLLRWGAVDKVSDDVSAHPERYSDNTVRILARALAPSDPRRSIRVMGLLFRRPTYRPGRDDLMLRYPLPYGDMPALIAADHDVPVHLFHGLIRTESAWDTEAVSRSGAQGLAQFMPATWEEWLGRLRLPPDADPLDPRTNLIMSAAYLQWLMGREWTFSWMDTLASYNAGGGRVRTWRRENPGYGEDLFGESIPLEEPRLYIRKVLSAATIYAYLYDGESPGIPHQRWGLSEAIP